MEHALITHDFSLAYVADNNARVTPLLYSITGMWAALQGSILLWALVLAGYLVGHRPPFPVAGDRIRSWRGPSSSPSSWPCSSSASWPARPTRSSPSPAHVPTTGLGRTPSCRTTSSSPSTRCSSISALVGFTVPFAFAVAALVTGRLGEGWLVATRRYTLFAWAFLTVGIVLGAWWSYQVLGWGGFWAWDPVENAALLPWLCATAYLHSVMVQERRGLLRVWNLSLLIAAYSLDHPRDVPHPFGRARVRARVLRLVSRSGRRCWLSSGQSWRQASG